MISKEFSVWVDMSSLEAGVLQKSSGIVVEYISWLCLDSDMQYIKLVELDATMRGVNIVLQ